MLLRAMQTGRDSKSINFLQKVGTALGWLSPSAMSLLAVAFLAVGVLAGIAAFISLGLILTGHGTATLALNAVTGFLGLVILSAGGNVLFQAAKLRRRSPQASQKKRSAAKKPTVPQ